MNSRFVTASAVTLALALGSAIAADVKSGPQVGDSIPGPFNVLNVTGPQAGKSNCQV
jgi:hypothetical protein